jgi:hypothetical protein
MLGGGGSARGVAPRSATQEALERSRRLRLAFPQFADTVAAPAAAGGGAGAGGAGAGGGGGAAFGVQARAGYGGGRLAAAAVTEVPAVGASAPKRRRIERLERARVLERRVCDEFELASHAAGGAVAAGPATVTYMHTHTHSQADM